jgi:hypothetical protein
VGSSGVKGRSQERLGMEVMRKFSLRYAADRFGCLESVPSGKEGGWLGELAGKQEEGGLSLGGAHAAAGKAVDSGQVYGIRYG